MSHAHLVEESGGLLNGAGGDGTCGKVNGPCKPQPLKTTMIGNAVKIFVIQKKAMLTFLNIFHPIKKSYLQYPSYVDTNTIIINAKV